MVDAAAPPRLASSWLLSALPAVGLFSSSAYLPSLSAMARPSAKFSSPSPPTSRLHARGATAWGAQGES